MTQQLTVLFVEDSEDDVILLSRELRKAGYTLRASRTDNAAGLRELLRQPNWDLVISDYVMPGFSGIMALQITREICPGLPFILISGTVGEELAVESIKAGADDYLMKHNLLRLVPAVQRAVQDAANRHAVRQAESNLRASQQLLQLVYDHVSDVVILYTCEAPECRVTLINERGLRLVSQLFPHLKPEQILHQRPEDVETLMPMAESGTVQSRQARQRAMQTKQIATLEREFGSPPNITTLEFSYVPVLNATGTVTHLLATGRDVTARKAAEQRERALQEQLMQSQKLEALGTLAGGIAHDFNNLLAGIIGFAELTTHANSLDESREYSQEILQAGQRARDLVRQILTFSRRQNATRSPVQLAQLIGEVCKLLRPNLPATVRLVTKDVDGAAIIEADPVQLHQVVMNLCTNAIQAMPQGGELTIAARRTNTAPNEAPALAKADQYIVLEIHDTGTGMSPAVLCRVFEPFFTTKPLGQGTGLGLAVVHGIVRDHGGIVQVQSVEGRGTTFTVILPALTQFALYAREATPVLRGHGEQLLCVDDESTVSQVLVGMLRSLGYRVTSVTDPFQALTLFHSAPEAFAIVITDLLMRGLRGEELVRAMRQKRPDLPVVIISGHAMPEFTASDWDLTVQLFKPFTLSELGQAIAKLLPPEPHRSE